MEANGIPHAPLEARRSLRVGLVRDIFDTVTRSKECFLNNFQLPASHIEPLFNTRHLDTGQRPRSCANDRRVRQRGGARHQYWLTSQRAPFEVLEIPRTKRRRPTLSAFSAIEVWCPTPPGDASPWHNVGNAPR